MEPKLYHKYVLIKKGKPILYVELKKALYRTLQATLLFWQKLSKQLEDWGFKFNPHDWCVANKNINGKQCPILWHVDDLKILHMDPDVASDLITDLQGKFGKEAPLTVKCRKVHNYLGMTINFSDPGKVKFTMIDYIEKLLEEAPVDIDGVSPTPAGLHFLFHINETNPTQLDEATSQTFHHFVAKLLFLCKQTHLDIQTGVAFLTTRVQVPDEDDYKKLSRVIKYLCGTVDMPLTLEADSSHIIKWWINASFAVHCDMKSHTGGTMSLGKDAMYSTSIKQCLVTKSSTEAELVGVNDVMAQVL